METVIKIAFILKYEKSILTFTSIFFKQKALYHLVNIKGSVIYKIFIKIDRHIFIFMFYYEYRSLRPFLVHLKFYYICFNEVK